MTRLVRSPMFVPAHLEKMRTKALGMAVDVTVLDLEDAVPPDQKEAARRGAAAYIAARPDDAVVRINPLVSRAAFTIACGAEDVAAVVRPGLRGLVFPKLEIEDDLHSLIEAVEAAEAAAGMAPGSVELWAIIETAQGVLEAPALARTQLDRPLRLCFGAGDFTRDIGVEWTRDEQESFTARSLLVIASRAARLAGPIDSVFTDITDPEGLRRSAEMAKRLGFRGKFTIHPNQVAIVNEVFTPTRKQIDWARRVIAGMEDAERAGVGAFVVDGRMIDYPIIERAQEIIALSSELSAGEARKN